MTEIERLKNEWQYTLNLRDWVIEVKDEVPASEMTLENVEGETDWDEVSKYATIRLLRQADYNHSMRPQDKERILVHELLHLKFALLGESENELQNRIQHILIEDMAKALVFTKRGKV